MFLKSEFCEENLEFWLACEDFMQVKSPNKLPSRARSIYEEFIKCESPKEVSYRCHWIPHKIHTHTDTHRQQVANPIYFLWFSGEPWLLHQRCYRTVSPQAISIMLPWCPDQSLLLNGEQLLSTLPPLVYLQRSQDNSKAEGVMFTHSQTELGDIWNLNGLLQFWGEFHKMPCKSSRIWCLIQTGNSHVCCDMERTRTDIFPVEYCLLSAEL